MSPTKDPLFMSMNLDAAPSVLVVNADDQFIREVRRHLPSYARIVSRAVDDMQIVIDGDGVRVADLRSGSLLTAFACVVLRPRRGQAGIMSAIREYLVAQRVPVVNMATVGVAVPHKMLQYVRLSQAGVPVPMTVYMDLVRLRNAFSEIAEFVGMPFIVKADTGSQGNHNWLVKSEFELWECVAEAAAGGLRLLAQRYVPSDGDIRIVVMGGHARVGIHRTAAGASHLTNTSRGGRGVQLTLADLAPDGLDLALRAAHLMGHDISGVDLIRHRDTGQWHVLEVNSSPQLADGACVEAKMEAFTQHLLDMACPECCSKSDLHA